MHVRCASHQRHCVQCDNSVPVRKEKLAAQKAAKGDKPKKVCHYCDIDNVVFDWCYNYRNTTRERG